MLLFAFIYVHTCISCSVEGHTTYMLVCHAWYVVVLLLPSTPPSEKKKNIKNKKMRCDDAAGKPGGLLSKSLAGWDLSFLAEALIGCAPGGCGLYRRSTGDASTARFSPSRWCMPTFHKIPAGQRATCVAHWTQLNLYPCGLLEWDYVTNSVWIVDYLAWNRSPRFRLTKRRHWQMEMHILRCLLRVKSSDGS